MHPSLKLLEVFGEAIESSFRRARIIGTLFVFFTVISLAVILGYALHDSIKDHEVYMNTRVHVDVYSGSSRLFCGDIRRRDIEIYKDKSIINNVEYNNVSTVVKFAKDH